MIWNITEQLQACKVTVFITKNYYEKNISYSKFQSWDDGTHLFIYFFCLARFCFIFNVTDFLILIKHLKIYEVFCIDRYIFYNLYI